MSFLVTLREKERETKKGTSKSVDFLIPPAKIEELDLIPGDLVYANASGLFSELDQKEPTPVEIPIPGRIISAGGGSLAITVKKNIVKRYKLKKDYDLLIVLEVTKRSPRS